MTSKKLADIKLSPGAALDFSHHCLKFEDGGQTSQKSLIVQMDGETFEVTYVTEIEVQGAHRRKRNRRINVTQRGYIRKIS